MQVRVDSKLNLIIACLPTWKYIALLSLLIEFQGWCLHWNKCVNIFGGSIIHQRKFWVMEISHVCSVPVYFVASDRWMKVFLSPALSPQPAINAGVNRPNSCERQRIMVSSHRAYGSKQHQHQHQFQTLASATSAASAAQVTYYVYIRVYVASPGSAATAQRSMAVREFVRNNQHWNDDGVVVAFDSVAFLFAFASHLIVYSFNRIWASAWVEGCHDVWSGVVWR